MSLSELGNERLRSLLLVGHEDNESWVGVLVHSECSLSSEFSCVNSGVVVQDPVLVSVALAVPPGEDSVLLSSPAVWGEAPSVGHSEVPGVSGNSLVLSVGVSTESSVTSSSETVTSLSSEYHVLLVFVSEGSGSGIKEEDSSPVTSVVGELGDVVATTLLMLSHSDNKSSVRVLVESESSDSSPW